MAETRTFKRDETTIGDAAVDGLLAGAGAGLVMLAYLIVVGLTHGRALVGVLGDFDLGDGGTALTGVLTHLAVAAVYGVVYGLGARIVPRRWRKRRVAWITGLLYGLLLLLLAQTLFLSNGGVSLSQVPLSHLVIAHLIYGLGLGILIHRTGAYSAA